IREARVFLQQPHERLSEKPELRVGGAGDRDKARRIGSPEGGPGSSGELQRARNQRDGVRDQFRQLSRRQLAQASEVRPTDHLARIDEPYRAGGNTVEPESGQDLDQLELVVEVGVKPEHVPASMSEQSPVPITKLGTYRADCLSIPLGQEAS